MNFDKQPEFHIAIFGFMTAFIWEFLQMPFFDVGQASHWERTMGCTQASFGDAGILLLAYSFVSLLQRNRFWMFNPKVWMLGVYLGTGLAITIVIEIFATQVPREWDWGWRYSDLMPVIPFVDVGLVPIVMWIVIPLLTLWFARRQPQVDRKDP